MAIIASKVDNIGVLGTAMIMLQSGKGFELIYPSIKMRAKMVCWIIFLCIV